MFDLAALQAAVASHGRVARVVICELAGSSPREVGAAMLVWEGGATGTIGGGTLEWHEMQAARLDLGRDPATLPAPAYRRHALGPDLGQCCGGRVGVLREYFDADRLQSLDVAVTGVVSRPISHSGAADEKPLSVHALEARLRNGQFGCPSQSQLLQGWFIEPIARPTEALWLWGAGHVSRAIVGVLAPLGRHDITWLDTAEARFDDAASGPTRLWSEQLASFAGYSPASADHLIMTYSHELDLEICHRLLIRRDFRSVGLIGSETKWARFRSRLSALGHSDADIARIRCPIGDPKLGKHPQAIAIGVAADLLGRHSLSETEITDDDRDIRIVAH